VAVTGPTGDIGRAFIRALERSREVGRIVGMARRPFDPTAEGWRKAEYRRGDVLDRASVEALVEDADVVVHLAFIILGSAEESHRVNLEGSRNVFEAAIASGAQRLVYASSVSAYGFHPDNPQPLTEDVPPRGSDNFYYSAHKAELEALLSDLLRDGDTDAYVVRPSIVAGPQATTLIDVMPYVQLSERMPSPVLRLLQAMPMLKPVLPDPGVPLQLVHADDVASALRAGVLGRGTPGAYNLAGAGEITFGDIADALGWYTLPVPELAGQAAAELVARAPFVPPALQWLHAARVPVIMSTAKARRELRWRPRHSTRETLAETVRAARADPTGH
jgi:nucleoside-diphosphate-sugar epimerase